MEECCNAKGEELQKLAINQSKVLKIALVINLTMFFVEIIYGFLANSTSLMADSLDMLGDAFVYGVSIYAIQKGVRWTNGISLLKGILMTLFGLVVVGEAFYRFFNPNFPTAETMGIVATIALIANIICAVLLLRHRNDDINMRSTWLCSRNDAIANVGIILAAFSVAYFKSKYPDLILGIVIAILVLKSSYTVIRESLIALNHEDKH
ncbi:MAG: cation diffusion facilitator family transporter [Bacteriovoracaceae bacterium]